VYCAIISKMDMLKKHSNRPVSKHNKKKGNNSAGDDTSDDDHSRSGRGSSSSATFSDSGNSSGTGQPQGVHNNESPNTSIYGGIALNPTGPMSLNYGYLPFPCYRRMTPEEDLLATQQGIDLLVKQRQTLVDQLVKHHNQLTRSNEKESLREFSRQIDTIMRMRGFSIMPSPNPAKFHRVRQLQNKKPGNGKIERGVTFDWK